LPAGFPNLRQKEASCAVCRRKGKSSTLMIPGIMSKIQNNCHIVQQEQTQTF
jgi:hypothetical protein